MVESSRVDDGLLSVVCRVFVYFRVDVPLWFARRVRRDVASRWLRGGGPVPYAHVELSMELYTSEHASRYTRTVRSSHHGAHLEITRSLYGIRARVTSSVVRWPVRPSPGRPCRPRGPPSPPGLGARPCALLYFRDLLTPKMQDARHNSMNRSVLVRALRAHTSAHHGPFTQYVFALHSLATSASFAIFSSSSARQRPKQALQGIFCRAPHSPLGSVQGCASQVPSCFTRHLTHHLLRVSLRALQLLLLFRAHL